MRDHIRCNHSALLPAIRPTQQFCISIPRRSRGTPPALAAQSDLKTISFLTTFLVLIATLQLIFLTAPAKAETAEHVNLVVKEIAPGIHVHQGRHALYNPENRGDISNCGFIVGDEAVAVIDTCGTFKLGKALRGTIKAITEKPVRYVINTHMHPDHVFGNAAFKDDNPEFIAHKKMARGLAARAERYIAINRDDAGQVHFDGTEVILPNRPIAKTETINLGNRVIKLLPQPTAHTDNDLVIFDEKTRTLFLGDLLFAGHIPALDGSILGWLNVLQDLEKMPAERAVPGHGPHSLKWPEALAPIKQYLQSIVDDVRRMIAEGKSMSEATKAAGRNERDAWILFEHFHARNVSAAFAELEWE